MAAPTSLEMAGQQHPIPRTQQATSGYFDNQLGHRFSECPMSCRMRLPGAVFRDRFAGEDFLPT
jgi:hypothetical protein